MYVVDKYLILLYKNKLPNQYACVFYYVQFWKINLEYLDKAENNQKDIFVTLEIAEKIPDKNNFFFPLKKKEVVLVLFHYIVKALKI